ncbi:MAG: hypothetical protein H0T84_09610 [Tatlockia sp.]|nr:hypothetical protein [Tatlockia sp.]
MSTYIIFNTINFDGVGDYSHFEDIVNALRTNPKFCDVKLIAFVLFHERGKESNYLFIGKKLKALDIPFYYGNAEDHERFSLDEEVQKHLREADQVLVISYEDCLVSTYKPYIKNNIPFKYIGEHEILLADPNEIKENGLNRSLGLSAGKQGIKICTVPQIESINSWEIIQAKDPEFAAKTLTSTNCKDFKQFTHQNVIIPAYFNLNWDFIEFLRIFAVNKSYPLNKDILIVHSGSNFIDFFDQEKSPYDNSILLPEKSTYLQKLFKTGFIKQMEIVQPTSDEPFILNFNSDASLVVRIVTGYRITDPSFVAVYQLAKLAAVTGDNTFERCVSMNVLPFYLSTNLKRKLPTLYSLKKITQDPVLDISEEARQGYSMFFDPNSIIQNHRDYVFYQHNRAINITRFRSLNLPIMIKEWPKVCAYLRSNYNFYNKLEDIIFECIPSQAMPSGFDLTKKGSTIRDLGFFAQQDTYLYSEERKVEYEDTEISHSNG